MFSDCKSHVTKHEKELQGIERLCDLYVCGAHTASSEIHGYAVTTHCLSAC